jgi:hypothetical protein
VIEFLICLAAGLIAMTAALWPAGKFRWGRFLPGPPARPEWLARLFFGLIGLFFLYGAMKYF